MWLEGAFCEEQGNAHEVHGRALRATMVRRTCEAASGYFVDEAQRLLQPNGLDPYARIACSMTGASASYHPRLILLVVILPVLRMHPAAACLLVLLIVAGWRAPLFA